jgi:hypothetical protein
MKRVYVIFFFLTQILASCGITYKVRTTDNELEELLFSPCGQLGIELMGKGNSKFVIRQRFMMKEEIYFYPDSLIVLFNRNPVRLHLSDIKLSDTRGIKIFGEEEIDVSFELEDGVFDGDTIVILAPRYINCNDDLVTLDTIYYTFSNRLRIYGVNAL